MDWKNLYEKVKSASYSDYHLNQLLFSAVEGWSYPLVGAAVGVFESRSREGSSVDYTGNTEAALGFARELFPRGSFNIDIDENGHVVVKMAGVRQNTDGSTTPIASECRAPTIAIGILKATLIAKLCE